MATYIPPAAAERAFRNCEPDGKGCLISRYSHVSNTKGGTYAQVGWGTKEHGHGATTAHRAAWTHVNGQIPDDMTVDHLCRNGLCVNVDHLRLLSNFENARRTFGRDWPLGQCANGHPNSDLIVTTRTRGKRAMRCKTCRANSYAKYEAKRRAS